MPTGLTSVRLQRSSVGRDIFPMVVHPLLEKRDLLGLQGEAVTVEEFAMLIVRRPEGEPMVSWWTGRILVDKVRCGFGGDGVVG